MSLNRREFSTAAGVSLSAILAGCGALKGDTDNNSGTEGSGNNGGVQNNNGSDVKNATHSETADKRNGKARSDKQEIHEDKSMPGKIVLSDDAKRHLEVAKHTFTWMDKPPSNQCRVHVMLKNTSNAELTADMEARIYGGNGTKLSSTTKTDVKGPKPGENNAVYSLKLNNGTETAKYELEISDLTVANGSGKDASKNEDGTNTVQVVVQDGAGEPIPRATVKVSERGSGNWSRTQTAGRQGWTTFQVTDGKYMLTAKADGYSTVEGNITVNNDARYRVKFESDD